MSNIRRKIENAGRDRKLIKIKARKKDGTYTERVCEPYSFRRKSTGIIFYFYCKLRDDWRSLRLRNIFEVEILEEEFKPRISIVF